MSSKNLRTKLIVIYGRISRACLRFIQDQQCTQNKRKRVDVCTFSSDIQYSKAFNFSLVGIDGLLKLCESVM